MLDQSWAFVPCRRRWPNIDPTLGERLVFAPTKCRWPGAPQPGHTYTYMYIIIIMYTMPAYQWFAKKPW